MTVQHELAFPGSQNFPVIVLFSLSVKREQRELHMIFWNCTTGSVKYLEPNRLSLLTTMTFVILRKMRA